MFKTTALRYWVSIAASLLLLFAATGTAYAAWINLSHGQSCGPTQGGFEWSQSSGTNDVAWYQNSRWSGSQCTCISSAWDWYHLEAEAYNPGGGTSCDKLYTYFTSYSLPASGSPTVGNGCGSSTYKVLH